MPNEEMNGSETIKIPAWIVNSLSWFLPALIATCISWGVIKATYANDKQNLSDLMTTVNNNENGLVIRVTKVETNYDNILEGIKLIRADITRLDNTINRTNGRNGR